MVVGSAQSFNVFLAALTDQRHGAQAEMLLDQGGLRRWKVEACLRALA